MIDDAAAALLSESFRRACGRGNREAVDAALSEVGWQDALRSEGLAIVPLAFAELGTAAAASSAIDDVLAASAGLDPDGKTAFVLPAFGTSLPPARLSGGTVIIRGVGTGRAVMAGTMVVVATNGHGHRVLAVEPDRMRIRPFDGVDPRFELASVECDALDASRVCDMRPVDWQQVLAVGRVALAWELIGVARTMLRLAREHALARVQFHRPISSFQAVRHRLAESLCAIEGAHAAVSLTTHTAGDEWPPDLSPYLASVSKALAGNNARLVARHSQQVLAGVGFTAEHDFHRYFRRMLTLDGLMGHARTLTHELGEAALRARALSSPPGL